MNADYRLRGADTLFRHLSAFYPLYLFSVHLRNILKTRDMPDSLSYRLQETAISL